MIKQNIKIDRYKEGFGKTPNLIMQNPNITIEAKAIYSYLCGCAGSSNIAYPNVDKIRAELNISKNRYYKHFKILVDAGCIIVEKSNSKNIFVLCNEINVSTDEIPKKTKSNFKMKLDIIKEKYIPKKPNNVSSNPKIDTTQNEDKDKGNDSLKNANSNSIHSEDTTREPKRSVKRSVKTTTKKSVVAKPQKSPKSPKKKPVAKMTTFSDDVLELYEKIKKTISFPVTQSVINALLSSVGKSKIMEYVTNWTKFDHIKKTNPAGYFVWLVKNSFAIPTAVPVSTTTGFHDAYDNRNNFESRPVAEGEFEKYYYQVK